MLNGIGGKTIAEAKNNLTIQEAREWAEYVRVNGSLNIGKRLEWGFALVAHLIALSGKIKISGQDPTMDHFMPHKKQKPISLDDAIASWA